VICAQKSAISRRFRLARPHRNGQIGRFRTHPQGLALGPIPKTRSNAVDEFEVLKRMVAESEDDIGKAEGGNKAAGTRARKQMQAIKNQAQAVREKILSLRGDDSDEG